MWTFRSLIELIGRCSIERKLLLFAFKSFLFEGVFVGLSCMKTVIDGMSLFVAEGTYHSWVESMFSAERRRRRNEVFAKVVQLVSCVAVRTALSVLMRV